MPSHDHRWGVSRRSAFRGLGALVSCLLSMTSARAASPPPIRLQVSGACPSATALATSLVPLVSGRAVLDGPATDPSATVVMLEDLGSSYRITVSGRARDLRDEARDCDERAGEAAVLLALALEPPRFPAPPEPKTTAATVESRPPP